MTDDRERRPEGMYDRPDLTDPAQVFVDRAIKALTNEFRDDEQMPRFVVAVIEYPPEGRVALASTGDDEVDTHRILTFAAASVRNGMSDEERRRARARWLSERAGFEARN
jgi:hypothetical protein